MAKGNDGNLLQHCVEVELAAALGRGGPVTVVLTHGMKPFEKIDGSTSAYRLWEHWLSYGGLLDGLPAVVSAYRATGASRTNYPNSAELLRATAGAGKLSGIICEVDDAKAGEIATRLVHRDWSGTTLELRHGSWRRAFEAELPSVASSWLLSMDPMQFSSKAAKDDALLYRADLDLVRSSVAPLFDGGKPGAVAIFSYTMTPDVRAAFETAVRESFAPTAVTFVRTTARGGNQHVVAVVTNREAAVVAACSAWDTLKQRAKLG